MIFKRFKIKHVFVMATAITFIGFGCGESSDSDAEKDKDLNLINPDESFKVNINGEIFSIPSPIQTAFLIQKTGSPYNKALLNNTKNTANYSTSFQKALNLGIFGSDLAYVNLYDQTQDAMLYMNSVKKLADELGITGAFDANLIKRFSANLGNKDSLLVLTSLAYRESDAYLKTNERTDISALIIVGGWIETLYFATNVLKVKPTKEVKERIAQQKLSLESLIKLFGQYNTQNEYVPLVDGLKDLYETFKDIQFNYTFVKPTTEPEKKLTTINSKTEVVVSDQQIEAIAQKIQLLRNQLVQSNI